VAQSRDIVPARRLQGFLDMVLERSHVIATLRAQRSGNEQNQDDDKDQELAHGLKPLPATKRLQRNENENEFQTQPILKIAVPKRVHDTFGNNSMITYLSGTVKQIRDRDGGLRVRGSVTGACVEPVVDPEKSGGRRQGRVWRWGLIGSTHFA
jgi:hypothetical protein